MGIFTKLGLSGLTGGAAKVPTQNKFRKMLTASNLLDADPVIPSEQWTKVGKYTVPAQELTRWGFGDVNHPDSMGYIYIYLETDAPGEFIGGKVRLVQSNAQETVKYVIAEFELSQTHGSLTNRAMQIPLEEQLAFPMVGEDSLLFLELYTDTGDTMDTSDCVVSVPVTVYM